MKFALIDRHKVEASKGAKGNCIICGSVVVAKCGEVKIHHWAHKGVRNCDSWWEPETEWHRTWKNKFPVEWQEKIHHDAITNEKHIADIRTEQGLVIEFQHSHMDPLERRKREEFYKNMLWVVDGARLKGDYPRFLDSIKSFKQIKGVTFRVFNENECFPQMWIGSSVPVIFDFLNHQSIEGKDWRNFLCCLLPVKLGHTSIIEFIPQQTFADVINNGTLYQRINTLISDIIQVNNENKTKAEQAARAQIKTVSRPTKRYPVRSRRF